MFSKLLFENRAVYGDNVQKYGVPRQATDDNTVGRMRLHAE